MILAEQFYLDDKFEITPETQNWALANPTKPLLLHDWTSGSFHDDFAFTGSSPTNYNVVTPLPGSLFDGLAPINIANVADTYAVSINGGEAQAQSDVNSTAISLNGNVWGIGPLVQTYTDPEQWFPYLDVIFCKTDYDPITCLPSEAATGVQSEAAAAVATEESNVIDPKKNYNYNIPEK